MIILFILQFRERINKLNAYWDLIFEHNSSQGDFFSGINSPINCSKTNLYSNLVNLNDLYLIDGYYEFLLEYPELIGFNRWLQKNNPMNELEQTGKTATGYTPINISWSGRYWGGLCKSNSPTTYIDGSTQNTEVWWYSIGSNVEFEKSNGIPGPCTALSRDSCIIVRHVKLYARIISPTGQNAKFGLKISPIIGSILLFM